MGKNKSKSKKVNKYIIFTILLVILSSAAIFLAYTLFAPNITLKNGGEKYLLIYEEDSLDDIFEKLEKSGSIKSMGSFKRSAKIMKYSEKIMSGRYELVEGQNNITLLRKLSFGRQTPIRISFNNIRTKELLADNITKKLRMSKEDFLQVLNDKETLESYGMTEETIISIFIPNTYEVYWNVTPSDFIERMAKEYKKFWNEERLGKLNEVGLTQTEVSTLASIVEEETRKVDEKPKVAGLYLNRIHKGIPLQADPTVKFALQNFSLRRIYKIHLEYDSPYNTYKYAGLPPGPIRIPSIESIDAVLNFDNHDFLYMCAKEDFSGYHNFAKTYKEHQKNAEKYRKALNKRGIR